MSGGRPVRVVLIVAVLVALTAVVLERGRRRSDAAAAFPALQGRLRVEGVGAPVGVLRDARGIPHIEASSEED